MQAEPKKRGPKSKAEKVAEALTVAFAAIGQGSAQEGMGVASEPVSVAFVAPPVAPVGLTVAEFIKAHERDDNVLVAVWHPDADGGIHQGIFSGIRLNRGPLAAQYSDGSKTDF
jgi:hypothetical protein